jgi:hypothetical protein
MLTCQLENQDRNLGLFSALDIPPPLSQDFNMYSCTYTCICVCIFIDLWSFFQKVIPSHAQQFKCIYKKYGSKNSQISLSHLKH